MAGVKETLEDLAKIAALVGIGYANETEPGDDFPADLLTSFVPGDAPVDFSITRRAVGHRSADRSSGWFVRPPPVSGAVAAAFRLEPGSRRLCLDLERISAGQVVTDDLVDALGEECVRARAHANDKYWQCLCCPSS